MATKYEYYEGTTDAATTIYGTRYRAESFTPSISHVITIVTLLLYKVGSPGWGTVHIRAVDGDGKPTGASLCSGTLNGYFFTTNTAGYNEAFDLGTGVLLIAGTQYVLELRGTGANNVNCIGLRQDESSPTYTGGSQMASNDGGTSWTINTGTDIWFQEWGGGTAAVFPSDAITRVTNLIHRYNRKGGVYELEMSLGEVTSDFGLPEWLTSSRGVDLSKESDKLVSDVAKELRGGLSLVDQYPSEVPPARTMLSIVDQFPSEVPPGFKMPAPPPSVVARGMTPISRLPVSRAGRSITDNLTEHLGKKIVKKPKIVPWLDPLS